MPAERERQIEGDERESKRFGERQVRVRGWVRVRVWE